MRILIIVVVVSFSLTAASTRAVEPKAESPLVKVVTKRGQVYVGELVGKPPSKGKWEIVGDEVRVLMDDGTKRVIRQKSGKYSFEALKPGAAWDDHPAATRGFEKSP